MRSGFEVVHPSTDQLVVVAHPTYWFAAITLLMVAIGIFLGIRGLKKADYTNVGIGVFLVALGIFLSSIALGQGKAVFDKASGTVTFDKVGLLFRSQHVSCPLSTVRRATVQSMGGGSYHFMVVFRDGSAQDIVGSTGATGQYRAAEAVNDFLAVQ